MNKYWILSNGFSPCGFSFQFIVVYYMNWFWTLNPLCLPEVNPTWLWYITPFYNIRFNLLIFFHKIYRFSVFFLIYILFILLYSVYFDLWVSDFCFLYIAYGWVFSPVWRYDFRLFNPLKINVSDIFEFTLASLFCFLCVFPHYCFLSY